MGKLNKIRKAVQADPDCFLKITCWVWKTGFVKTHPRITGNYGAWLSDGKVYPAKYYRRRGKPPHHGFVKSVLRKMGYDV